jgi:hypothetical protein
MKFFKKITTFKGSKPAEKEVGLATPSVAVVSAVAIDRPKSIDSVKPLPIHDHDAGHSSSRLEDEARLRVKQESQVPAREDVPAQKPADAQTLYQSDSEYSKAFKENIYLKEKNSLLLQLVAYILVFISITRFPSFSIIFCS